MEIQSQISLSNFTSMKVGGPAEFFCEPQSLEEVMYSETWAQEKNLPITILSGGTNVLIADTGIRGLVVSMGKYKDISSEIKSDRLVIEASAGTPKSLLLKEFLKHKLAPAMFLAGLPGDIGGGVVMNAGIGEKLTPREFVEIIDWVEVLRNGVVIRYAKSDLNFSYRHCEGWKPGIILQVALSWPLEPDANVIAKVKELNKARIDKQPLEWPNSGSVFMNPPGHTSGRLIDECGLKGFQIGDAQVSEKHANFIINKGHAKASDIKALVGHIQKIVLEKKQIRLTPEWILLGF